MEVSASAAVGAPAAATAGDGWHARLELGFESSGRGRTVLAHRKHVGPLRVQKALYPEGDAICHAVIVHPPGGIAGGDRLALDVRMGPNTHALLTTPGATKWYKTPGSRSAQDVRIAGARDAVIEWLPQEGIVFNHANASARVEVELDPGALFLGWDILCFGRTAMGETFAAGTYRQRWQIRQAGRLLWNEAGDLRGGSPAFTSPVGLGGAPVCATLVAAGRPIDTALIDAVRKQLDAHPAAARSAATRLPQVLAVRYVGPSAEEAREAFIAVWSILRPHLTGRLAQTPRIWRT